MSRSAWKFIEFSEKSCCLFLLRKFGAIPRKRRILEKPRNETINYFNRRGFISIHQGKVWVIRKLYKFHVNYKIGSLVKTRKPFCFRPKKKKK